MVNCTDDLPLYHEASGRLQYMRFHAAGWRSIVGCTYFAVPQCFSTVTPRVSDARVLQLDRSERVRRPPASLCRFRSGGGSQYPRALPGRCLAYCLAYCLLLATVLRLTACYLQPPYVLHCHPTPHGPRLIPCVLRFTPCALIPTSLCPTSYLRSSYVVHPYILHPTS